MKLQSPERIRGTRAAGALQAEVESTTRHFDLARDIRPADKERIISDLVQSKPSFIETTDGHLVAWGNTALFNTWLGDFERCAAVFPDALEKLDNTPEQWEKVLREWKAHLSDWRENEWQNYLYFIQFIWAHFPDKKSEFPVDPSVGREVFKKIQEIHSRNPIDSAAILQTLKSIRTLLPDLFATLTTGDKGLFKAYPNHLQNPRKAPELAARLAYIRLVFPDVFEAFTIPEQAWAIMKAELKPIKPDWESDVYLGDAYHLRIIAADEAHLGDTGELIIKDQPTRKLSVAPVLPERSFA